MALPLVQKDRRLGLPDEAGVGCQGAAIRGIVELPGRLRPACRRDGFAHTLGAFQRHGGSTAQSTFDLCVDGAGQVLHSATLLLAELLRYFQHES